MNAEVQRQYLPALRGKIGDWVYYCTLMTLSEASKRIDYAKVVHKSTKLSDRIQRELDDSGRAEEIARYLRTDADRFFNALVVAVYGGSPDWHQIDNFRPLHKEAIAPSAVPELTRSSIGLLSFTGTEQLYALDGQHRLAGIRHAISGRGGKLRDDEVPIIFVAHRSNKPKDIRRTRKLFTTLNKTARAVKKNEIIALDESDVMALCARYLIEDAAIFKNDQIDVERKQANLPPSDRTYWMTISNLYDVLEYLFKRGERGAEITQTLKYQRPRDPKLKKYFAEAEDFFKLLARHLPEVRRLLSSPQPSTVIRKYRKTGGGHLLFRPVGLLIFADVIGRLMQLGRSLGGAIRRSAKLPTDLAAEPYKGTIWRQGKVQVQKRAVVRDWLLYRLGALTGSTVVSRLKRKYAAALNKPIGRVRLPAVMR